MNPIRIKRLVAIAAWLFCAVPAQSQADLVLPYDSLRTWLIEENYAAWAASLEQIRSGDKVPGDLPAHLDVVFLPLAERPEWAQVPDSMLWHWMYSGFLAMESQRGTFEAARGSVSSQAAREKLVGLKYRNWKRAGLGIWALACALGLAAGWLSLRIRRMTAFDAGDWHTISDELQSPQANPSIWEDWRAFLNLSKVTETFGEKWALLSPSEKEVAEFLVQHLPVSQIAKRMACSQSYVYNLRSSIRRKWDLDPDDDLVRAILAERKGKL